jgi:hypothetical protein
LIAFAAHKSFLSLMFMALISANGYAWDSTYVDKWERYVILCVDGTTHTYSGSEDGLQLVGDSLCSDHGGIVGWNPITSVSAKMALHKVLAEEVDRILATPGKRPSWPPR